MTETVTKAFLQRDIAWAGYSLLLGIHGIEDKILVPKYIEWEALEIGGRYPTKLILNGDAVQQLMNDLWHAGVRPDANDTSHGEVEFLRTQLSTIIGKEWS